MCGLVRQYGPLLGRILLSVIFIIAGVNKITGFEQTAGYMASKGLPMTDILLVLTIIIELGGGRQTVGEKLDLSVGFSNLVPVGAMVSRERPLAVIHAASESDADIATTNLLNACKLGDASPAERPTVYEILTG